jgi:Zn-dependent peptidase ImmA (M78 family)
MRKLENGLQNSKLKRGFKTEAEKISLRFRNEMGLYYHDPLDAFELAEYMGIAIHTPHGLNLPEKYLNHLVGPKSGWSAFTILNKHNNKIIVHNNLHSNPRQQSNIMHELSHIICEHANANTTDVYKNYELPSYMREFDDSQEAEAIYLGACLQLPREGLLWAIGKEKMSKKELAAYYMASNEMVTFRINSTGIKYQLKYTHIR